MDLINDEVWADKWCLRVSESVAKHRRNSQHDPGSARVVLKLSCHRVTWAGVLDEHCIQVDKAVRISGVLRSLGPSKSWLNSEIRHIHPIQQHGEQIQVYNSMPPHATRCRAPCNALLLRCKPLRSRVCGGCLGHGFSRRKTCLNFSTSARRLHRQNHYEVLDVPRTASIAEIKAGYFRVCAI